MKRYILHSVILNGLILQLAGSIPGAIFAQESSSIEGVWELVTGELRNPDNTVSYPNSTEARHMKIITKSHFTTVWVDPKHDGDLYPGFNGGTYTYLHGLYVETHTYQENSEGIGNKSHYKVQIEGDRFFLSPATETGEAQKNGFFEEWKRIE